MTQIPWKLVIHGGAGVIERGQSTPSRSGRSAPRSTGRWPRARRSWPAAEARSTRSRRRRRRARGRSRISTPGAARSSPIEGTNELDAAIMDGRTRDAGAVTGVTATKQPDQPRPGGDGAQPARLPEPRGRRPILARAGARAGRPRMVRDRRAAAPARRVMRVRRQPIISTSELKYGTVGAVAVDVPRPCRRRDLDRRPDRQALGPDRRFAADRRRHLCRRPGRRGLGDRRGRIFHPRRRRPRDLRPDADARRERRRRRADKVHRRRRRAGRKRRGDRGHRAGRRRLGASTRRECIAGWPRPRAAQVAIYADE